MKPAHAVSLIEAAYRHDLSTEQWLEGIAAAGATALESNRGAMMFRYDITSGDWIQSGVPALHGLSPEFAQDFFNQPDVPREAVVALVRAFLSVRVGSTRAIFEEIGASDVMSACLDRHGVDDMLNINGIDPSGRGCVLAIAVQKMPPSARSVHLLQRIAAHISAGNRLRATLETLAPNGADRVHQAEAVLTPNGKVEHATGAAEPRAAREALRNALVRIDAARSERDDARRSVELWRGLVAGRWSLVEHFERDGKRYYLAHKNDPELAEDRALTRRERLVLGYSELGNSNKLIGYSLGLSSSTVSTLLGRARKKVGVAP